MPDDTPGIFNAKHAHARSNPARIAFCRQSVTRKTRIAAAHRVCDIPYMTLLTLLGHGTLGAFTLAILMHFLGRMERMPDHEKYEKHSHTLLEAAGLMLSAFFFLGIALFTYDNTLGDGTMFDETQDQDSYDYDDGYDY